MKIDQAFLVAGKMILAGNFGGLKNSNPKGYFDIIINGHVALRVHIEGEVFDNTAKTSLWTTAPANFDVKSLNLSDSYLMPAQTDR